MPDMSFFCENRRLKKSVIIDSEENGKEQAGWKIKSFL